VGATSHLGTISMPLLTALVAVYLSTTIKILLLQSRRSR
jgi:hypothetical protein